MMQAQEKRILQNHRSYLIEHLSDIKSICDSLYEDKVFTQDDIERIGHEVTSKDKVRKFLDALYYKDERAIPYFMTALLKANKFVYEKLNENCPYIQNEIDDDLRQFIQTVLSDKFVEEADCHVSFDEVLENLRDSARRNGRLMELEDIDPKTVTDLVKTQFKSCRIESPSPRGKHKRTCIKFVGIWAISANNDDVGLIEPSTVSTSAGGGDVDSGQGTTANRNVSTGSYRHTSAGEVQSRSELEAMDTDQLYSWLKDLQQRLNITTDIAGKFKDELIDGMVFVHMTEEEMKGLIPLFGPRKKLLMERDKIIKSQTHDSERLLKSKTNDSVPCKYEHFRAFDRTAKLTDKYRKGSFMTEGECRIKNFIDPIHRFVLPENDDMISEITLEVVKFGAACMNEKTNGTIHFGIVGSSTTRDDRKCGEIVGVKLDREKCQKSLTDAITSYFYPEQHSKALSCIRPAQFIEVSEGTTTAKETLYVVEIDIVSSYKIVKDEAFFLKMPEDDRDEICTLYRYPDNNPVKQSYKDTGKYMVEKAQLSEFRKVAEDRKYSKGNENLNKKLTDFLCCGNETIESDIYPLLFISAPDKNMGDVSSMETFSFLKDIQWRAVFDFDGNGNASLLYNYMHENLQHVSQTKCLSDFDENSVEKKVLTETYAELKESSVPPWIFCSSELSEDHNDATSWKLKFSKSFRDILNFYHDCIPKDRARVLFILLSKNYDVMQEAAIEVMIEFQEQCLIIAESELTANQWKDALLKGHCITPKKLEDCCLTGLPWAQLNQVIDSVSGRRKPGQMEIPRSNGVPCVVSARFKMELSDLEILGQNDCKTQDEAFTDEEREKYKRNIEEKFYVGEQVAWSNLYYEGQVLRRDKSNELKSYIRDTLDAKFQDPDECVGSVAIYHQPGAGGTTLGKQMLWELRDQYRCCVVRKITSQTGDQLLRLYEYQDEECPKPILVLIDNGDNDQIEPLYEELQKRKRSDTEMFCVLLVCYRKTEMPSQKISKNVMLLHKLSQSELNWFKDKNQDLLATHKQKKGCNPNQLLSFNIMKEDFKIACIERSVYEFVQDMNSRGNEGRLIKYVAFLNSFDVDFKAIPAACFDPIMSQHPRNGWECRLSQSARVLLSRDNHSGVGGKIVAFRVSNALLSRYILNAILELENESTGKRETIGEVAYEFLHSLIFKKSHLRSHQHSMLLKIMINIAIKREWEEGKRVKFSPLVHELLGKGDIDAAVQILETVHELTDNHIVAQQIARLYEHEQNWKSANSYADKAIQTSEKTKQNSYLWHTKGQIQRSILLQIKDQQKPRTDLSIKDADSAIRCAQEAITYFREVQVLSRKEECSTQNLAGYDGEIQTVLQLLELLSRLPCFDDAVTFRRFLVDKKCSFNTPLNTEAVTFLKSLQRTVFEALEMLENDIHLVQERPFSDQNKLLAISNGKQLDKYKAALNYFFETELPIEHLNIQDRFTQNRRLAKTKGATSLLGVLKLKDNYKLLMDVLKTIEMNLDSRSLSPEDYRIAIAVALSLPDHNRPPDLLKKAIRWSREFFDNREKSQSYWVTLEACLYLTLLHWPTNKSSSLEFCPQSVLKNAVDIWNERISSLPSEKSRRDKILFYLCNGRNGHFFIYEEIMKMNAEHISGSRKRNIFRTKFAFQRLARLEGTLRKNGQAIEVKLSMQDENRGPTIYIPVSSPIKRSTLWNRKVYFFLGFGLHGIKAQDISDTNTISTPQASEAPQTKQGTSVQVFTQGTTDGGNLQQGPFLVNPNFYHNHHQMCSAPAYPPTSNSYSVLAGLDQTDGHSCNSNLRRRSNQPRRRDNQPQNQFDIHSRQIASQGPPQHGIRQLPFMPQPPFYFEDYFR